MLPDLTWPPARWREEAVKYAKKAAATTNLDRREKYMERATLYFSHADRVEYEKDQIDCPLQAQR
jgi:hypothetical protein